MHRYLNKYRGLSLGIAIALAIPVIAGIPQAASAAVADPLTAATIAKVPRFRVQDLGRASSATRIDIAVALKYRHEDELEALIRATSDPASPQYGHFLTPQQFLAAYAPTVEDYRRVAGTLARSGFTVTGSTLNRSLVHASARASVVESFFGTTLHAVRQDRVNGLRYANASPAHLPASLRDVAYGVAGLNNLVVARAQNVRARAHRTDAALGFPLQGPDTGLGPYAFATAYDLPVQHARPGGRPGQTIDGTGHNAGIAIDSDLLDSDLASFLAYFQVKRTGPALVRVPVDGGTDINFDNIETALDLETISSLAPGAGVYLYLMPDLSTLSILDTYDKVVADNKVDVLNSSFGGCEISDDNFAPLTDHIAKQGVAEGITFTASSGDLGAQTCLFVTPDNLGVSAPASGTHFTAAGGTSLLIDTAGTYKREFAWNGSGGGVSTIFGVPAYQTGIPNLDRHGRNVPDISFDADPGTGAALFLDGIFQGPLGGTSLSAPILSALVTEYNEQTGRRSGNLNFAIYAYFKQAGYGTRFRDITFGNNSYFGPGYNASPGYDEVTGIGSVIGTIHAK